MVCATIGGAGLLTAPSCLHHTMTSVNHSNEEVQHSEYMWQLLQ